MEFEIINEYERGGNKQIVVKSQYCEREVFGFPLDSTQEEILFKLKNIFKRRKSKNTKTNLKNKKVEF